MKNIPHLNKSEPWKPFTGKWKVTKLPRDAGTKSEMTQADYDRMHPKK